MNPGASQRAFTLVEIVVVIAIIAIATGVTFALAAPDPRNLAQREARAFARQLEYAMRSAQWRHQLLGVSAAGGTIRYWRRDASGTRWIAPADDALRPLALPSPVEARALSYGSRAVAADSVIPLRASGRNEPFVFAIDANGWRARVSADPLNRIAIAPPVRLSP